MVYTTEVLTDAGDAVISRGDATDAIVTLLVAAVIQRVKVTVDAGVIGRWRRCYGGMALRCGRRRNDAAVSAVASVAALLPRVETFTDGGVG